MRLRSHLLALTLSTLLPMAVFGISATALIVQGERQIFQRGAQERTRALLTALDTQLTGQLASLRALASSRALAEGDIPEFHGEAARIVSTQRGWRTILLSTPSGEPVFRTGASLDERLPPLWERESFDRAVRTSQPTVGNLVEDDGAYRIPVRLPVGSAGGTTHVLTVLSIRE